MLSPETLDTYRRMSPGQRLRLTLDLSHTAWRALLEGPPEVVARRFERLRQENELRDQRITAGLKRAEQFLAR
ncbi:MAG: hypothetical protein NXI32_22975 [bacterium]|nr:hypothetical protein [bacterium]